MDDIANRASSDNSEKKFATKEASYSPLESVYGLAQCTPDLSNAQCKACLQKCRLMLSNCCNAKQGARILSESCNVRYNNTLFYDASFGAAPRVGDDMSTVKSLQYDLGTVQAATNNFSDDNIIGKGGFGQVYKILESLGSLELIKLMELQVKSLEHKCVTESRGGFGYGYELNWNEKCEEDGKECGDDAQGFWNHFDRETEKGTRTDKSKQWHENLEVSKPKKLVILLESSGLAAMGSAANTGYKTNLTILLGSLPSKAALNSFYNGTFNGIFSFYLCRGDGTSDLCQNCVKNASQEIQNLCPSNNQAIIWYAQCMLSYNNSNFFGLEQTYPRIALFNRNSTSPDDTAVALSFMYTLVSKAPFTDMMFSVGESGVGGGGSQPRYGLAQCRRDISSGACSDCLGQLMGAIDQCCQGKRGWRVLAPSCYLRYEEYLFFAPQLLPPPTASNAPLPAPSNRNGGKKTVVIALGVVSAATTVVLTLLGFYCYRRRSRKGRYNHKINIDKRRTRTHPLKENIDAEEQEDGREMHYFNLKTINVATNGFSDGNKLGQGGFGPVYKAWRLWDGGKPQELIDRNLIRNCPVNEVSRWIHIGLLCVQENPGVRPSMSQVVLMLGGQSTDLPMPSEPPLSYGSYTSSDQSLSDEVLTGSDETTPSSSVS
ncbi:hypothetical protein Vadar_017248 [Vaccinium darrowii]|uniref:Uncharacterized protein n=1 Tax=Vaccinium darrowii TaxID=229202 RepID=A0ACB7XAH6_9ERIC|nr:hypothetical protein Vadar_017248 [Vaccinium darrowii]